MFNKTRWIALSILVVIALFAAGLPATPASAETTTPDTLPFGPSTGTFHLHFAKDMECSIDAARLSEADISSVYYYATNVADDSCARTTWTTSGSTSPASVRTRVDTHIVPAFDQSIELVEGEPVTATIWIWTETAGAVSPRVVLTTSSWTGSADAGTHVAPLDVQVAPDGLVWQRFDLDLGAAPAAFASGPAVLTVHLDNTDGDLRRVSAPRSGLGVTGDHKSTLSIPFDEQVDSADPIVDPVWPPALEAATVRPGVKHVTNGAQCTTNFVFRDRTTDKLYMGTAAHCIDNVGVGGKSSIGTFGGGTSIVATVAFSTWETPGLGSDFALMEIPADREKDVHPAVIHFGGPTHLAYMPSVQSYDKVITYGNSGLRPGPQELDWHEGYVTGRGTWYTNVYTVTPAIFGDSGSGIMTADGGAIGAASTIHFAPVPGQNSFGNIPPVIDWMNRNGWDLELQTWDLLDGGVLPAPFG